MARAAGSRTERAKFCLECGRPVTQDAAGAVPKDGDDRVLGRGRIDVAGGAARSGVAVGRDARVLRRSSARGRTARRNRREVPSATRCMAGVRACRACTRTNALRAARAAVEMRETLARLNPDSSAATASCSRPARESTPGRSRANGLAPDQNFVAGDTANYRRPAADRPPARTRSSSVRRRNRVVRDAVEAELLPPLHAKGKPAPRHRPPPRRGPVGGAANAPAARAAARRSPEESELRVRWDGASRAVGPGS